MDKVVNQKLTRLRCMIRHLVLGGHWVDTGWTLGGHGSGRWVDAGRLAGNSFVQCGAVNGHERLSHATLIRDIS